METFLSFLTFAILIMASIQDQREKEVWPHWPIAIILINTAYYIFTDGFDIRIPDLMTAIVLLLVSVCTREKIGLGDVLVLIGFLPLCHMEGVIRIITDSLLLAGLYAFFIHRKRIYADGVIQQEGIAFIPFITVAFLIWWII